MKNILFTNIFIFAFLLGAKSLSAQCAIVVVISNETTETCIGSSDASALATGAGAGQITYLWSNGQTTALATGLTAGTYTVTATDSNGCTDTAQTTIEVDAEGVWIMTSATDALCNGSADGTAHASVMTGVAPYTYIWDDPAGTTNADPINLLAGTYHVTVTDVNGCSNIAPVTVNEPTVIVVTTSSTPEICFGDMNGTITSSASGGTGTKTYLWSNGATDANLSNLGAGNYGLTVTDANGCESITTVNVGLTNPEIVLIKSSNAVSCFGGNDGIASVSVTAGNGPFSYAWSNGQATATATSLSAGNYEVTVTGANGCTATSSVSVSEPAQLIATATSNNITCFGANDGSASVSSNGGTGNATYSWSNGNSGANISNLAAGTYTATVTDANGCTSTLSISVSEPTQLTAIAISNNITCFGANDGSASISSNGGTGTTTYNWSNGNSGASISNLAAGTYTATATDANGCTTTSTTTVSEPTQLTASAILNNNVTCFGANDGSVSVSSTGGTGTASYSWSNGQTGASISNLAAGTYTVTATDANGCTTTSTITVSEPTQLTATGSGTNVTSFGGNDGSATASPTGGTPPYTYSWSNGGNTATISNLIEGIYTATITDGNGCTTTVTVEITQPNPPIVLTISSTPATCGATNGTATVSASGGISPYTYLWSGGQTTATANNLAAGTYTVTVTDNVGTTSSSSVVVGESPSIMATASHSDETCAGSADGHVAVSTTGGTGQNTFLWSNGATTAQVNGLSVGTYTVTVTDALGCTATASAIIELSPEGIWVDINTTHVSCFGGNNGSAASVVTTGVPPYIYAWSNGGSTPTISNLTAGTYTVSVTDVNGCVGIFTTEITEPTQLTATATSTNVSCNGNGGTVSVTVNGGTPNYTYSWSNGQTTQNISGLNAGTYTVTATDTNGCTVVTSTVVGTDNTVEITSAIGTNPTTAGGSDGSIDIEVSGGTPGYTYIWSNGATTQDISGLMTGCYTVTVTDTQGCSATSTTCIDDPGLTVTVTTTPNGCMGNNMGTATANASDGTAPYTYMWATCSGFPLGSNQTIVGLTNGCYAVTVTDANGVQGTATGEVTGSGGVSSSATAINILCNGDNTGSATANGIGGAPFPLPNSYQYNWSNNQTTQTINNLTAGTYTVTVTDQTGCTSISQVTVTEPSALTITSAVGTSPSTNGGSDGSIDLEVSGGTQPYTYLWSNGATTQDISGLTADCYMVTVTDANNCTAITEVCLLNPLSCTVTVTTTPESCVPGNDGTVTATPSADCVAPFTYQWEDSGMNSIGNSATITGLSAGTYSVTVTDNNGTTAVSSGTVQSSNSVTSTATGVNLDCFGDMDGSVTGMGTGGTSGYTYEWSDVNGSIGSGATINNLSAGTYTVTVTDINGCTSVSSVTLTQPTEIVTTGTTSTNPTTVGGNDGSIDLMVSGGTQPYTYLWSNSATTQDISGLTAGCYTVTITDANNCTATLEVCITDPPPPMCTVTVTTTPESCVPGMDGTVTATPSADCVAPFTYQWEDSGMNPIGNTATVTGLSAGTYSVTVTDDNGTTAVSSGTVQSSNSVTSTATGVNLDCFGDMDGSVTGMGTGGTPGYTYEWSDVNGSIGSGATINNLPAGTYTVTVTDINGCTSVSSVTLTQPTEIVTTGTTSTNPSTMGASDGSIDLMVSGGTPGYTYQWTGPMAFTATTQDISGLVAGCYDVTITDANNCTATLEVCLVDPLLFAITATSTNNPCTPTDNGIVSAEVVSGGVPPVVFKWENSNMDSIGNTKILTGLPAGTYTVYATDAIGQMDTQTVVVIDVAGFEMTVDDDSTTCDDIITLNASTNIGAATISWFEDMNASAIETGTTLSNYQLSSGENMIYVMAVFDSCVAIDSVLVMQQGIDVSVTPVTSLCVGEITQLSATNNNAPQDIVTYQWTPMNAFSSGANTATPTLNTAATGIFEVYLATENQHGCTQLDTVTFQVQDSTNNFIQNQNCNNLEVVFNNTNGPNEYLWDFGDGSTPVLAEDPTYLYSTAGTYMVMMILPPGTNNAACLPDTVMKEIEVFADPIFNTDFTMDYDPCVEDSTAVVFTDISTNVHGNIISWDWELPNGATSTSQQDSVMIAQTGTYAATVVVEAPDGCMDTLTQNFDITVFNITLQDTLVACAGTTDLELNPFGNPDYNYQWSGGLTGINPSVTVDMSTNYMVTITDPNSAVVCQIEKEVTVIVPEAMSVQTSPDTVLCEDGQVVLNANSTLADGYNWYDIYPGTGTVPIGTGADLPLTLDDLTPPQYYFVEAIDSFGCITMDSVLAGQAQIVIPLIDDLSLCLGRDTSITTTAINNGDSTYYEWINDMGEIISLDNNAVIAPTAGGVAVYTVNISNEYGCEALDEFNVNTFDLGSIVQATGDPDTINYGEITQLEATHPDGNYTYQWSNENTLVGGAADANRKDPEAAPTSTTNYQVLVTDNNGCTALASVLITVVDICDDPYIFLPNAFSPNDDGENDVLYLRSAVATEVYFIIYNRWGEKVFESNSINDGWDGRHNGEPVCSDVYGYYLRVKCISGKEYITKGNVTVLK